MMRLDRNRQPADISCSDVRTLPGSTVSVKMDDPHGALADLTDCCFEPQQRSRLNTWPLPRPDGSDTSIGQESTNASGGTEAVAPICSGGASLLGASGLGTPATAKRNSRRKAWGCASYADLITQAISTAPEKRLTLSQIYEWMIQNVPYFKDKGERNSSAGWKNSIRHNLSLHNRFMRVHNEGAGKSSWWMINPGKEGTTTRRRAASIETSTFEKRRGRVKLIVEALRNSMVATDEYSSSSPCSSVSDMFPDSPLSSAGHQLSPEADGGGVGSAGFRPRASSWCPRLSPISAGDTDWDQSSYCGRESPKIRPRASSWCPRLSPISAGESDWDQSFYCSRESAEFRPRASSWCPRLAPIPAGEPEWASSAAELKLLEDRLLRSQNQAVLPLSYPTPLETTSGTVCATAPTVPSAPLFRPYGHAVCPVHWRPNCSCGERRYTTNSLPPLPTFSTPYGGCEASAARPAGVAAPDYTTARSYNRNSGVSLVASSLSGTPTAESSETRAPCTGLTHLTAEGVATGASNLNLPDDLNLSIDILPGAFKCNVDEIIQLELNLEGRLDFNFSHQSKQRLNPGPHQVHYSGTSLIRLLRGPRRQTYKCEQRTNECVSGEIG